MVAISRSGSLYITTKLGLIRLFIKFFVYLGIDLNIMVLIGLIRLSDKRSELNR